MKYKRQLMVSMFAFALFASSPSAYAFDEGLSKIQEVKSQVYMKGTQSSEEAKQKIHKNNRNHDASHATFKKKGGYRRQKGNTTS
jgi:outer membrane lipoprotein-sorting protein